MPTLAGRIEDLLLALSLLQYDCFYSIDHPEVFLKSWLNKILYSNFNLREANDASLQLQNETVRR